MCFAQTIQWVVLCMSGFISLGCFHDRAGLFAQPKKCKITVHSAAAALASAACEG